MTTRRSTLPFHYIVVIWTGLIKISPVRRGPQATFKLSDFDPNNLEDVPPGIRETAIKSCNNVLLLGNYSYHTKTDIAGQDECQV